MILNKLEKSCHKKICNLGCVGDITIQTSVSIYGFSDFSRKYRTFYD